MEIQGNILAGLNKDHQIFLFLAFPDPASGRAWLSDLIPRVSTTRDMATFNEQFSQALRNRGGDDPENLKAKWINVGPSAGGIRKLAPMRDMSCWTEKEAEDPKIDEKFRSAYDKAKQDGFDLRLTYSEDCYRRLERVLDPAIFRRRHGYGHTHVDLSTRNW